MTSHPGPENDTHPRSLEWAIGGGLALAAFGLYLSTLAPTVLEADGGEFQFVPWLPGIAHPTGYPLYVLLGWLWTHLLPLGEVAWRMNLLSAVLAAAAIGITYAVARQILDATLPRTPYPARLLAAITAAATFAVSHAWWTQTIIAEVYALHTLFITTILWLAINLATTPATKNRPLKWGWLALLVGLGLTHHRTVVLLLPALAVFLWFRYRAAAPTTPRHGFIYAALLLCPLLLYLYLPLIAPYTPYATLNLSQNQPLVLYDNSLTGFWQHITATVFSGELQPAAAGIERLQLAWQLLLLQVGSTGAALAAGGLLTLWQRRRFDLLLLTGLTGLTFVAFNLVYFIGDVFVLFIPVWLMVCLWLGLGSLGLAHWLAHTFVKGKTGQVNSSPALENMDRNLGRRIYSLIIIGLTALGLLLPLSLGLTRYAEVNQAPNTTARDRWQAILAEPLLPDAVLLSNDRNEIMPLWYYQYVEGRRPDLFGLFPLITPQPEYANVGRVLDEALASGRPVYLIKPMAGLALKADVTPAGSLFLATANHTPPVYPLETALPEITITPAAGQTLTETITLSGYDVWPPPLKAGDPLTVTLHWRPTQALTVDYTSYVHLVSAEGQGLAQSDHRPGGDYYPSSLWQPGEILRDSHRLIIPANLAPGQYRLRAGLYYQPQPGTIAGMGNGVEMGSVSIEAP